MVLIHGLSGSNSYQEYTMILLDISGLLSILYHNLIRNCLK
jgi:hypothetical protein